MGKETINHILFQCQHVQAIWRCANIHGFDASSGDIEDNIERILQILDMKTLPIEVRLLPIWLCWIIWKSRNEFLFQKRNVHPNEDVKRGQEAVFEWICAYKLESFEEISPSNTRQNRSSRWEPPPPGWLKCNFDSSLQRSEEYMGTGWILRDHYGKHILSGCAKLNSVGTPLQAEAQGFLHALQTIWSRGYRFVWFEGDNAELTRLVNTGEDSMEIGSILYDIRVWISKLPECSLATTNRERNQTADTLSKKAFDFSMFFSVFHILPLWLRQYLYPHTRFN